MAEQKKPSLLQRLNAVQKAVTYIEKEKKQGMRYSIVSHDAVTAKVRPAMVEHGIVYYPFHTSLEQSGNRTQVTMIVRFVSIDDADDYIDVATAGFGIDDQDKGPGKAISYAVKYALLKALGLESGDDPDKDQDVKYVNPNDPHIATLTEFTAAFELAEDEASLKRIGAEWASKLEPIGVAYPAKLQATKQAFAAKLHAFKQATGQTNGHANGGAA